MDNTNNILLKDVCNNYNNIINSKQYQNNTNTSYSDIPKTIIDLYKQTYLNQPIIIGISGIPGSGKSSLALSIQNSINDLLNNTNNSQDTSQEICVILPMDGYHLYAKGLTSDQLKYRGRIDTFDLDRFNKDLINLSHNIKSNNLITLKFPNFDHKLKDPTDDGIQINLEINKIILVEGIYLYNEKVNQDEFNLKLFIKSDIENSMNRVAKRSIEANICNNDEEALQRAFDNDLNNANYVLKNSILDKYMLFVNYID